MASWREAALDLAAKIYPGRMLSQRRGRGLQEDYSKKGPDLQGRFAEAAVASVDLARIISPERFARYLSWAGGDQSKAVELYALNSALSEALYTPLQMLEVALRNGVHDALSKSYGERWFDRPGLLTVPHQQEQLDKAKERLTDQKRPLEPGRIVAGLTFGFWTAMLNKGYEALWRETLHKAMHPDARDDGKALTRKALTRRLHPLRELRNRIAHHEPILDRNLPRRYETIIEVIGWLSPDAAHWTVEHSRFPDVCPDEPLLLQRERPLKTSLFSELAQQNQSLDASPTPGSNAPNVDL